MRKISDFSVNHPVTVMMFVLGILLLGIISFDRLGVDLFPDLNNPRIYIELKAQEAPPEEIEKDYVEQIESLASRSRGVVGVSSAIRVGSARITVEYSWDTDMDEAFLDLQKSVSDFSQNNDVEEITITQHDPNSEPVMTIGLMHPEIDDMDELRKVAENYIRNELTRLEGVAGVEISGEEEKEVVIMTDSYLLEAYGLTPDILSSRIMSYNQTASGGSITEMGLRYLIKGVSVFESIEDIENIILTWKTAGAGEGAAAGEMTPSSEKTPVYLKDVATIDFTNKDPRSVVLYNGKRCLGLSIYKEMKFNTVEASKTLHEMVEKLGNALPGYEIVVIQDQGSYITGAIDEVKQTAMIGIFLAILILYIFLRRLGTTLIVSMAIPISVVATFNLMYFNGLTLNIMTLGGLALGAGMLVDNAIVVLENIVRNMESGMSVREASITGASQVGGAITASTITTIVVFLPIVYLHGASGELFKDQAWTVAFSLISSLVVAIFVIPMLCSRFIRPRAGKENEKSVRFQWYGDLLDSALRHRWIVIGAAALLVATAWLLLPSVGSEFIPRSGMNEFSIKLNLPEGTELERTVGTVRGVENMIRQFLGENVKTLFSTIGPVAGISGSEESVFQDENTASIKIILAEESGMEYEKVIAGLGREIAALPDIESEILMDQTALLATLGAESAPVVIEIEGDDIAILEELTETVKMRLGDIADLYNIETSLEKGRPEVEVVVDRLRAGMSDIGVSSVSSQLEGLLSGKEAGYWDHGGEKKDITIRTPDIGLGELSSVSLDGGDGKIRLSEIADIRYSYAPKEINRRNQARTAFVTAHQRKGRPFDHLIADIRNNIGGIELPAEYKIEITGEEEKRQSEFNDLKFALILSIVLVYMVMAAQFESLIHPFSILLTIPLAGVGAVLIFFILGKSLNIMAYIGMIMLVGIAVNDSIILVDAITRLRKEGVGGKEAIIEAGRRRIRPIIMTSATTILALLPMTLGFGEGAALRSPMALAVIGGLITSTILTLLVIPCVYSVLDRVRS
ncbi:MAG: efflux RND transporter permease subunit [Candidatus Krumholzibacteriota bacterium]|nr:efflux RND transporter permease subunit [Candidatus Krumholzibacteriota bacterium]